MELLSLEHFELKMPRQPRERALWLHKKSKQICHRTQKAARRQRGRQDIATNQNLVNNPGFSFIMASAKAMESTS